MKTATAAFVFVLLQATSRPVPAQRLAGSHLDRLPAHIEAPTQFGERHATSPDSQSVAFMAKSFGDAMTIDLKTRAIRCLTCGVPAAAFLRVIHLVTGDYILTGAAHSEDIRVSRTRDNELWFLNRARGSKPVKFNEHMSEGMAISKKTMQVAYSQVQPEVPEIPSGAA